MIEYKIAIADESYELIEAYLYELGSLSWSIWEDKQLHQSFLMGVFLTEEEAATAWAHLCNDLGKGDELQFLDKRILKDRDWKEAYKDHFHPWSSRGLHWVPIWLKDQYEVADEDQVVWLDPGMAFGTGNHETTRLCAERLLDIRTAEGFNQLASKTLMDAGCGSGILSISAALMGVGKISGLDNDTQAIKISEENADRNFVTGQIDWKVDDLSAITSQSYDIVVVNILANILTEHAATLIQSVNPGGYLILSGILEKELEEVKHVFENQIQLLDIDPGRWDSRTLGEWGDLCWFRS